MSTYQQRGYTVEVGFAVGHLPEGPVDPDPFRISRQEAEAALREMEEFVVAELVSFSAFGSRLAVDLRNAYRQKCSVLTA
jgi:hypothetical protein